MFDNQSVGQTFFMNNKKCCLIYHIVKCTECIFICLVLYIFILSIFRCKAKVEAVGSCCTLVAEEIFLIDEKLMDPQIAMLLYGKYLKILTIFNI